MPRWSSGRISGFSLLSSLCLKVPGSIPGGTLFFLLGVSWSDHFYIPVGNTTGNGDSEKHMVVVLAIIVSSENSSPSCDFFDRYYCKSDDKMPKKMKMT